jgi:divalent metal cation (Fe/Co/Zn/Cd) transporter
MEEQNLRKLYRRAYLLALITIIYNLLEGLFSVYFGTSDETLALFGFGVDSFVEVISGIGIAHLITRLQKQGKANQDTFERTALRITGTGFYILAAGLVIGAGLNIFYPNQPKTTIAGIIISGLSIVSMYFLMNLKLKIGKLLKSDPLIADANCTKTCLYLSIVLMFSSVLFEIFRISYIDIAGSLAIAWFSFSEGKEAFEKAKGKECSCSCHCSDKSTENEPK